MGRDFMIWDWSPVKHAVRLDDMENFVELQHFVLGKSLVGRFPENVQFRMARDRPRDTILTDYLVNVDSLLVISERLRDFLEQRKVKCVEYLPVAILDHKGKPVASKYFIAHTVDDLDCLDVARAQPLYSEIRKASITLVKHMAFDEARIDPERELFQVKNLDGFTFAARELADAITAARFTGIKWLPIADYDPYA